MNSSYQKAKDIFNSGFCCAESVLKIITDEEKIGSPLLPAIATGFCGGISRTCGMCGAVTGGILALNVVFGRSSPAESAEKNYSVVQRFESNFKKEFGSINCQELLGCDLGTKKGQTKFRKSKLRLKCADYTGRATELVRTIIDEEKSR